MISLAWCDRRRGGLHVSRLLTLLLLVLLSHASSGAQEPGVNREAPKILEEDFAFPSPIQWRVGDIDVSLTALAWGPADSPEMISKGRDTRAKGGGAFFADRPYALAMCFRGTTPRPIKTLTVSGLAQVKNVEGSIEYPSGLTAYGFASFGMPPAGALDLPFLGADTTDYCDFFPAARDQREFLFQVIPTQQFARSDGPRQAFRIIVKDNRFVIVNATPGVNSTALRFRKKFTGTVGSETQVNVQLTANGSELSGTEQYVRIGKTLWLKGALDSLGNFVLKEYYPKDQETGIFDGKFVLDYRQMSGYFSKPDGSRLQPFRLEETSPVSPTNRDKAETQD